MKTTSLCLLLLLAGGCNDPTQRLKKVGARVEDDGARISLGTEAVDADLAILREFDSLKELNVGMTTITDRGLAHLRGLETLENLYLPATRITDSGLRHLADLENLVTLSLSRTEVDGSGLAHLRDLPKLASLNLLAQRASPYVSR